MRPKNKTQKNLKRNFSSKLNLYSTPRTAQHMAYKYLGKTKLSENDQIDILK